jgi:large repetitive protein
LTCGHTESKVLLMAIPRLRTALLRPGGILLVCLSSVAAAMFVTAPAQAALSGTGWTAATLPASFVIGDGQNGPAGSPVSCVPGTEFCVVIATDDAVTVDGTYIGQGDLVTTDGGQTWTGYADLPSTIFPVEAISCPSTSVCWVTGQGNYGQAVVAESTDGGQTWADVTPAAWGDTEVASTIDCATATTCFVGGMNWDPFAAAGTNSMTPWIAGTTDGGATWTTFSNLPTFTPYDPNGTYTISGISCTSALDCVAVGGLNLGDGLAQVISTTDGGATWSRSTDPTLSGLQDLFSVSCLPGASGLPVCTAAGSALDTTGPVEVSSADGGATWSGMETYNNTGWLSSVSCADATHCWAAGSGTTVALVGTDNGGASWSSATSDTSNEEGSVSCATADVCVATTDNALWVTSTDGALSATAAARRLGAATAASRTAVSRALPEVSGSTVAGRIGRSVTITGQYRNRAGMTAAKTVLATIKPAHGSAIVRHLSIGLNHYYSTRIAGIAQGTTTVTFTASNASKHVVRLRGYRGPAPRITSLSAHAGPTRGGSTVTIRGKNLSAATRVYFGSRPGRSLHVRSSTRLSVRAPAGAGAKYLTVVTSTGGPSELTGRAVYNFLPGPALSQLSPADGPAAGGTTVTITGSNLAFVSAVYFGTHRGTHLKVLSPWKIMVTSPAGAGAVNVRIVTAGGRTGVRKADLFTYQ